MANITVNFLSYTLHRAVDLTVIIPTVCFPEMMAEDPHHPQNAKYPVLYLFHGYGNNHLTWNGYTSVELYAEERQIAVVMLSAENKAYINHGGDDNYYDFIAKELPEFIRGMFPVSDRPEDTFVAGLSMGGFGALVHGLSRSREFAAIGAFSGAVARKGSSEKPETNPLALAKAAAEQGWQKPLYIACGDADGLFEANKDFVAEAKALGFPVTWVVGEGYGHEWRFWNREVEAFMDWLPRTDAYYNGGRKRKI